MFSEFLLSLVWLARDAALALCSGHHLSKMAAQNGCQSIISWPFGSKPSLVQSRPANQWLKMAENVNTWLPILLGPVQIKYPKWRKNIFFFLSTSIQTLGQFRSSWQVLNNQNGGKILFVSCPVQSRPWSNPDQAGRYPKWRQNYVSFAPTMAASIVVKGITLRWTLYWLTLTLPANVHWQMASTMFINIRCVRPYQNNNRTFNKSGWSLLPVVENPELYDSRVESG